MGQGGGALFLLAKMGQNSIDEVLVLDTYNDSRRSTTATANFNIDIEYSLESLGSVHSHMTLDR